MSKFVRAEGRNLVAADGRPLHLRGIGLGNWLLVEGYMFRFDGAPQSPREIETLLLELAGPDGAAEFWEQYRAHYITAEDIGFLRQIGLNSVRVPLHYKFFETADGEGFRWLDRLVGWCREAGLYVIPDLHAAPGGQTGTNIDDGYGHPWLFASASSQRRLAEVWARIAAHYRDEPAILGYELLNEPIPPGAGLEELYNDKLEPLYRRVTAAIRTVDQNHLIIYGGAQWNTNFSMLGTPFDAKAVYAFHRYWTATDVSAIREYLDFGEHYQVPVWCSEAGENLNEWIAAFRQLLDAHGVGWAFWPYKKMLAPGERLPFGPAPQMLSTAGLVSFHEPRHWPQVVRYSKAPLTVSQVAEKQLSRPTRRETQDCLASLLENIKFKNCPVNTGFIKALGF
ncbi:MAG: glycoside hydrolase family 5 protein [Verrucomicrobiales bacterium]|jgi:hypothetical protein|nr:glycoside hydrolase family 5 protein [Verrucomicrobiales bacterium]